jgi:hypothetical protein
VGDHGEKPGVDAAGLRPGMPGSSRVAWASTAALMAASTAPRVALVRDGRGGGADEVDETDEEVVDKVADEREKADEEAEADARMADEIGVRTRRRRGRRAR